MNMNTCLLTRIETELRAKIRAALRDVNMRDPEGAQALYDQYEDAGGCLSYADILEDELTRYMTTRKGARHAYR